MVRTRSEEKLHQIVSAALEVFLDEGFKGTRMDQVAEAAGVSPGTLYLYVAGKEALFELTLRVAFGDPLPDVEDLPYDSEVGSDFVEWIWERLQQVSPFSRLRDAASRPVPEGQTAEEEFMGVVEELWSWEARYWRAIELLEKCAREWPELDLLFYKQFRRELFGLSARYLSQRMERGLLLPYPDPETATRAIAETVTFFAMHRHIRPDSSDLDEEVSRETVLTLLRRGFVPSSEGE